MKKLKKQTNTVSLPRSIRKLFPQVTHTVDADKPVEVSVSADDCKTGKKLNPAECALARAAKREFHADGVVIGMTTSYIIKGNKATRFATPESVAREILSFDRHQDFAPGDYYLNPKSPSNRFDSRVSKKGGDNKITTRKHHHSARVRILEKGRTKE